MKKTLSKEFRDNMSRGFTPENLKKAVKTRAVTQDTVPKRKSDLTGEKRKIIEDTTDRIKNILIHEGVTYKELAAHLEMTQGHVSHLMSGTRNMTLGTLSAIGEAVGYRFTVIPHKIDD